MVKIELNRISVVGLVVTGLAILLLVRDLNAESPWTIATLLGEGAPFGKLALWMVLALGGLLFYLAGRVVWIVGYYRDRLGVRPRERR